MVEHAAAPAVEPWRLTFQLGKLFLFSAGRGEFPTARNGVLQNELKVPRV